MPSRFAQKLLEYLRNHLYVEIRAGDEAEEKEVVFQKGSQLRVEEQETELEVLRKSHEEARSVLEHQIKILDDIDDKAARTVRITIILLGAIVGTASFGDASGISLSDPYLMWGNFYLITSVILGVKTYNVSDPFLGTNSSDIDKLVNETNDESDMLDFLLEQGYQKWITENEFLNSKNGMYLDLTHFTLAVALIWLTFGFTHQVVEPSESSTFYQMLENYKGSWMHGLPLAVVGLWRIIFGVLWKFVYSE